MKTLTVLILTLGSLLFLSGAHSDVTFHEDPLIVPSMNYRSTEVTRWINQDGRVTWDPSREQHVAVYAEANGIGEGKASLVNFSFNGGPTLAQYDGSSTRIGRIWLTNGFFGFFKKQKYQAETSGKEIRVRKDVTLPDSNRNRNLQHPKSKRRYPR